MSGTGIAGAADHGPASERACVVCGEPFGDRYSAMARALPGKGVVEYCKEHAGMTEKVEPATDEEIIVRYTNWRGETADRRIRPCGLTFGTTKWHPERQWFLEAWDQDKGGFTRMFALNDMAGPTMTACMRAAEAERDALREEVERLRVVGWIVASGDRKRFRCWTNGMSDWTDDHSKAIRYARREDAEAVHQDDEDAWFVFPVAALQEPVPAPDAWKALEAERTAIADEARRYASHYPEASDGRNTFILLAEWIERRSEAALARMEGGK